MNPVSSPSMVARPLNDQDFQSHIEAIEHWLEKCAEVFPARAESHEHFVTAVAELTSDLIESIDFENFNFPAQRAAWAHRLASSPVFICGQMKAGTTLLVQLLDGHSDLAVIPFESHFNNTEFLSNSSDFHKIASHWMWKIIRPTGQEPYWFLGKNRETLESFLLHLRHFMSHQNYDNLASMMLALECARNRSSQSRLWVEKTPQNELHVTELVQRYPDSKFLHIVRNPLPNLASLKRNYQLRGKDFRMKRRALSLKRLMRTGRDNLQKLGEDHYRFVRYEDLVHEPETSMREIAGFLGIEFAPSLMRPSENGRAAQSNSMYKESRVQGRILDLSQDSRYRKDLTEEEVRRAIEILETEARKFGYDWSDLPERGLLAPRLARIRNWVRSRNSASSD